MKYHHMKFNIKILLVFLPLSMLHLTLTGQTKKAFIKEAELNYTNKNFYAALVNYEKALEFDENDTTLLIKAAESARQFLSLIHILKVYL